MDNRRILEANLAEIRASIDNASRGRQITLVCVTKYVDVDIVLDLIDAGATHLGENRIIEGSRKFAEARSRGKSFTAHMIGGIQSNKAAKIPSGFEWCQSLSSEKVARILDSVCGNIGSTLQCTAEVNIGLEPQKDGVLPDDIGKLVEFVHANCRHLSLRGLMCIPPVADERDTRAYFSRTRALFDDTRARYAAKLPHWDTLSMGMSADYVYAIQEGATMVRVGSSLFKGLPGIE